MQKNQETDEILLQENPERFSLFPIKYKEMWDFSKLQETKLWLANEIDYVADLSDWSKLDQNEKHFIEHILAFFATADGIVVENLVSNFAQEVKLPEARANYAIQIYIEMVHAETYARHIEVLIEDPNRRLELFRAIEQIPCIKKKANWAIKWMTKSPKDLEDVGEEYASMIQKEDFHWPSFAERLVAFAVVEGVFFSGSFCAIFWLKSRGKMIKGLGSSNEFIARDETMHCNFAILQYKLLKNKLTEERVHEIFSEAVEIEKEFIVDSIPCKMVGMNSELMIQYIKFVANYWIVKLGYNELYKNVTNPFPFMVKNGLYNKSNFFEKRDSNYSKSYNITSAGDRKLKITDNF